MRGSSSMPFVPLGHGGGPYGPLGSRAAVATLGVRLSLGALTIPSPPPAARSGEGIEIGTDMTDSRVRLIAAVARHRRLEMDESRAWDIRTSGAGAPACPTARSEPETAERSPRAPSPRKSRPRLVNPDGRFRGTRGRRKIRQRALQALSGERWSRPGPTSRGRLRELQREADDARRDRFCEPREAHGAPGAN